MKTMEGRRNARSAHAVDRQDLAVVTETIDHVRRLLSPGSMPAIEEVTDFSAAARAIKAAWDCVDRAIEGDLEAAARVASASDLLDLTVRLRRAEKLVDRVDGKRLTNQLGAVRETLGRFNGIESVSQLTQECPRAISQLGFDRGMLSMVTNSVWTPASAHSDRQPEWANQLVEMGQQSPQELIPTLPEFDLVRRQKSILVTEVHQNPKVYKEVVAASQSRSYVASRIVANGNLVGFIHGDRFFHREDVDDFDCNLLGLFGEAFGFIYARAAIIERSAAIHSHLASLASEINQAAAGLKQFEDDLRLEAGLPRGEANKTSTSFEMPLAKCGLTTREKQILQLMANGANNADIACRLYIANGTVKSHVKHILRKLGAANRAEAVARWFNSGPRA
ncbi:MAG TPA: LuxR C-terminal-related transcriptional regulator [Pseudonocardia sp.]|jgi:DNA-binding CsgD family transcriptional regulator|uniref:helix-turn-helix transcriptional regulator n=1 Tax=Pseudonocardia sp. TaxID=60912 RepID=UPI002BF1E6C0|nr:LuxR C-terminal-related transcriptional regulator [Pseudonocardia sp.]HTF50003.1 LuxR C-terminal-related transcriptional regulator [Pseudonocardia sp.]